MNEKPAFNELNAPTECISSNGGKDTVWYYLSTCSDPAYVDLSDI